MQQVEDLAPQATGAAAAVEGRAQLVRKIAAFARDEQGAVTVDWVLLTALIVGLNLVLILTPVGDALSSVSTGIAMRLTGTETGPPS